MIEIERLLAANRAFAQREAPGARPAPPAMRLAVLTCMDARVQPVRFLGLGPGDAHVIRNAGGRATDDALRSLVLSANLLGTRRFLVIHHTDCGLATITDEQVRAKLTDAYGAAAEGFVAHTYADLEQSVRDDVAVVRHAPLLPGDVEVTGWVYDVASGRLDEVDPGTDSNE